MMIKFGNFESLENLKMLESFKYLKNLRKFKILEILEKGASTYDVTIPEGGEGCTK